MLDVDPLIGFEFVENYYLFDQLGTLDLSLENEFCTITTEPLNLSTMLLCDERCEIEFNVFTIKQESSSGFNSYVVFSQITNFYPENISLEISSSQGVFIPSHISILAGQMFDFTVTPITFIPNANFNGQLIMNLQASTPTEGIVCSENQEFNLRNQERPSAPETKLSIKAYPNPAKSLTHVQYDLEQTHTKLINAKIRLYTLTGVLLEERKLSTAKGMESFDLANLASGKYILVFLEGDKRIDQQILIKE